MKKYLAAMLTIILYAINGIIVYAGEDKTNELNEPMLQCNVTFYITDETKDGYSGDSFTAIMTDKTKTIVDSYTFTRGNSWGSGNIPKYTVIAPTTYTVTFDGVEDGYVIVNTLDYSKEISFEAASGGLADCYWSIIDAETDAKNETDNKTGSELLEQAQGNFEAENEKAEEIYQSFLNATAFIANDDEWYKNLLIRYELFPHEERYAEYVEGGTKEEYLAMSLYDRFVWHETYLVYAWAVNTGDFSTYFGSEENFKFHITDDIVNLMKHIPNYEAVEEAYIALAKWQYDYIKETGVPFNFINNRSYLEETKKEPIIEKDVDEPVNNSKTEDDEEISEIAKELLKEADETTKNEVNKNGIWNDVIGLLSKNLVTIAIILILCIIVSIVIWKRKKFNIDDNNEHRKGD